MVCWFVGGKSGRSFAARGKAVREACARARDGTGAG